MASKIEKLYNQINSKYLLKESINQQIMDEIIQRIVEIDELYYKYLVPDDLKNSKFEKQFKNSALCYKILANKTKPTPSTINTVLSFLTGVYVFVDNWIEGMPAKKLFNDSNYLSLCLISVYNFDVKYKNMWIINDGTLNNKINYFLKISNKDIIKKMKESKE